MLNIINCIMVTIIFIVSYYLFAIKNDVNNLNYQLAQIDKQIREEINNINIIKAELSHLTTPDRLRKLSTNYLYLTNIQTSQMIDNLLVTEKVISESG
ncbi:hypothetical protein OCHUTO_0735 [Orientia chuto str. Dubai]|uniref:Cell division protein FtsL n=1 Tax=Orientia chuto str. Dubai TaxID=1359168 RepID=A0A0F3MMA1_9RICK|nr:hypothetical protein [Candidatus Orientia mediorientalis]KJV55714.1 hypothetical protein OCHUTO_0735 [Orientia chuto str. Dubai]